MRKNNKANKKVQNILIFAGFSAVILMVSTYAWFIGLQEVTVESFTIEIASTDNLLISLNGVEWGESVTIKEGEWTAYDDTAATPSQAYTGHRNSWGNGLAPMSSVGNIDLTSSTMELFERGGYTHTGGGFRLIADQVDNNLTGNTSTEVDGYVAFDMFIRNFTGAQYIEEYEPADEEKIYLLTDSGVSVASAGTIITDEDGNTSDAGYTGAAGQGIENSVRVAFAQIGRVAGTEDDASVIGGISCGATVGAVTTGVTGICEPAQIWEPNEGSHAANAIDWFGRYCDQRTDFTTYTDTLCQVSSTDAAGTQTFAAFAPTTGIGSSYLDIDTWAVNSEIVADDKFDIYDGHNAYAPFTDAIAALDPSATDEEIAAVTKVTNVDTFTDLEKNIAGENRPEFMTLAPNSITKIRVYVYLEGNDLDNMDLSAAGKQILVNFGFTKSQLEPSDFTP